MASYSLIYFYSFIFSLPHSPLEAKLFESRDLASDSPLYLPLESEENEVSSLNLGSILIRCNPTKKTQN